MKKNTYNCPEKEMVLDFCKSLEQKNITFSVEVPFLNRSIDLAYQNETNGVIYAIEFKIKDWRKAITQIRDYTLGVRLVFICIPANKYTEKVKYTMKQELAKAKCGLMTYNADTKVFKVEIQACENEVWENTADMFRKGFEYSIRNRNYEKLLEI